MDKLFIPIQGCLLEVVREQYTEFYRDKEWWPYLKKLDTKNTLLSLDGFVDDEGNALDFIADEAEQTPCGAGQAVFLSLIRNYQGIKELDATIINTLIDKILVSEREKLAIELSAKMNNGR